MGWGEKGKTEGKKPFGVELKRLRSTGADELPEGEIYFAGTFYGDVVEVFLHPGDAMDTKPEDRCGFVMPPGGWFGSGFVPPLIAILKTPFSGVEQDSMELGPVGAGISGVGAGFGNAAGASTEVKMQPIQGDLNTHILWVGPNGWQARFSGGENNRLEKLPTLPPAEPAKAP